MTFGIRSLEDIRTKFYQKEKEAKSFINLNENDLASIAKKVYKRNEFLSETKSNTQRKDSLSKYIETLEYLTNQHIHLYMPTYDERLAFLIMTVDPNLETFKEFLKFDIKPLSLIAKERDVEKRNKLLDQRKINISAYQSRIREKLGFYDGKLLKYEEKFFIRFMNDKELLPSIAQNHIERLLETSKNSHLFESISHERYQEISEIVQIYLSQVDEKNILTTTAYSVLFQKELLTLKSSAEQCLFFILAIDPELNILKIYEEESRTSEIQRRCLEEYNYYSIKLITLERLYHQKFCPEKELSPWTFL